MKQGDLVASKYRLDSRLGQGGMGAVWSAKHEQTGREFAIKFMHPIVASSDDSRQRFLQEARASARINHPNIIDIFDVGETEDGALYLVMELLEGLSLADALRTEPPFNARELLVVLTGAATALAAAHAVGVVHRDVKPPNVFLHRDRTSGVVKTKVLDFGVSKVFMGDDGISTHTGSLLGSPRYMSPEQAISATSADGRADVWSLGVVMFEALTGRFPHDGDSSNSLVVAIATKPPKSIHAMAPQLPLGLRLLIEDCLKPVEARLANADLLVERLFTILSTEDLTDLKLARPSIGKSKTRPRPDNFLIQTTPGSIPGLATSMARASTSSSSIAAAVPRSLPPPLPPVVCDPTTSDTDVRELHDSTTDGDFIDASLLESHTDVTELPFAPPRPPPPPAQDEATLVLPMFSESIPEPSRRGSAPALPNPDAGRPPANRPTQRMQALSRPDELPGTPAPQAAPLLVNPGGPEPPDPSESVSSINVVRGTPSRPLALATPGWAPRPAPAKKIIPWAVMTLGTIAALSLVGIVVILSTPSAAPEAATTNAAIDRAAAGVQPLPTASAAPPRPSVDAMASATASADVPDTVASVAPPPALPSARFGKGAAPLPSATVAATKPLAPLSTSPGSLPPKPKPSADPFKDLGSGL